MVLWAQVMRILISADYEDSQDFIEKLAQSLGDLGVLPGMVNLELAYGDEIFDEWEKALSPWDYVVVVLTKAYVNSDWFEKELIAFALKERATKGNFILPVLIEDCGIPRILNGKVIDFRNRRFEDGFYLLASQISKHRQVFVVTKYEEVLLDIAYKAVIKPVIEEYGFSAIRSDEVNENRVLSSQFHEQVAKSEIVLVDLTGASPHCYLLLGLALALEKEIIITVRKGSRIYFDAAHLRFIEWDDENELREGIRNRLAAIQSKRSHSGSRYKIRVASDRASKSIVGHKPLINGNKESGVDSFDIGQEAKTRKLSKSIEQNNVFISYSHKDSRWLKRLQVHLRPLERISNIDRWDDTRIKPGSRWKEDIKRAIDSARVAVLLVSADFLASDFIITNELPRLLKKAETDGMVVLSVITSPCLFEHMKNLSQFQAVNLPTQPLLRMAKAQQEQVFVEVALSIWDAIYD